MLTHAVAQTAPPPQNENERSVQLMAQTGHGTQHGLQGQATDLLAVY